jgi:hypothetical protein
MRSIEVLAQSLKKAGINAPIIELSGQCIGVSTERHTIGAVKRIAENLGYINIQRHEYEYSYGEIKNENNKAPLVIFY